MSQIRFRRGVDASTSAVAVGAVFVAALWIPACGGGGGGGGGVAAGPLGVDDAATAATNVDVVVNVLANDLTSSSDPLMVVSVTEPDHGSAVIISDAEIRYTPDPGFCGGTDGFDYTATDGVDVTISASVTVEVGCLDFSFAADPQTLGYDPAVGQISITVPLTISEDLENLGFPHAIREFEFELRHDPCFLEPVGVRLGADLAVLRGGAGPLEFDFFLAHESISVEVVIGDALTSGGEIEVALVDYETRPAFLRGNPFGLTDALEWGPLALHTTSGAPGTPRPEPVLFDLQPIPVPAGRLSYFVSGSSVEYDPQLGLAEFDTPVVLEEGTDGTPEAIQGFSVGIAHDPAVIAPIDVSTGADIAPLNSGTGPEFFAFQIHPDGFTAGVIISLMLQETLALLGPREILVARYGTNSTSFVGNLDGHATTLDFSNQLGTPAIENIVTLNSMSRIPDLVGGAICFVPE